MPPFEMADRIDVQGVQRFEDHAEMIVMVDHIGCPSASGSACGGENDGPVWIVSDIPIVTAR